MRRVHGIDVDRVEAAVRAAESLSTGQIRVALARFYFWGDVHGAARRAFRRLRMDQTQARNGVLVFVAPHRRALAILGDAGLHQRVGDNFWRDTVAAAVSVFRGGDLTVGTVRTVELVGQALAQHFPAGVSPGANELPDSVVIGRDCDRD
jgi:uncharacterized membrane protein